MRNTDKIVAQNIKKRVLDIIKTDGQNKQDLYDKCQEVIERLDSCKSLFSTYLDDLQAPIAEDIMEYTKLFFEERGMNVKVADCMNLGNGYIQIQLNDWPSQIHLEWYPLRLKRLVKEHSYCIGLHLEGNTKKSHYNKMENDSELKRLLSKEFEGLQITWGKSPNRKFDSALFEVDVPTSSGKAFIDLSKGERKEYLITIYERLLPFIKRFDELI